MFADFSKKEFIETGVGGLTFVIIAYLAMMGLLNLIAK